MQIEIHARSFALTQALHSHIKRQMQAALRLGEKHILRVRVLLSDINGPKGGPDKRCQINVDLGAHGTVLAGDTSTNLYSAIASAAHRASRAIVRKTSKTFKTRHRAKQRALPLALAEAANSAGNSL